MSETVSTYEGLGFRFRYPSSWEFSEEHQPGQSTLTVQTPGTAFWSLTLLHDQPDPEEVLQWTVQLFESEYEDVDSYPGPAQTLCRSPALGAELDFLCYDLVSSASICTFATPMFTSLVIYQGYDKEVEQYGDAFEAISASLELLEDEEDEYDDEPLNRIDGDEFASE